MREVRIDEDGCAVVMHRGGDYAAVGKFFLPCCEKTRDALEIFVTAEEDERSYMWGVLWIAGREERQPT